VRQGGLEQAALSDRDLGALERDASAAAHEPRQLLADAERRVGHIAVVLADDLAAGLQIDGDLPALEGDVPPLAEPGEDAGEVVSHVAAHADACDHHVGR
jgi:hypothetical protein